ncbi:ankyrin repeat domain-containing protein [Noviherbaspirillum sp. 1P10PC]|uniref:ankyrin repeat domain-containing protein n=1 Tax=Noviherbaspirillum sp. 1P10PC TaxID=3132292 RepID=UPI00399F2359
MNRLTHKGSALTPLGNSSIFTNETSFSDDPFPGYGKSGEKNDFPYQLDLCIVNNQTEHLQALIQQQPGDWSAITAEELGKLLLQAVDKRRSSMVAVLIQKSVPGKAAAIPIAMQLELVEKARFKHNDQSKMSELLNALLPDADFPVQQFEQLVAEARKQGKHPLITALFEYKNDFIRTRQQGELPIYDAAAAGNPAELLKELDARLGIPPLDNRLSGIDWFFNALHRWVAELFAAGAAKRLVNQAMGNVPLLHAAVASGNTETVRLLIERGADLAARDRHGDTALSKAGANAAGQQNTEIVAMLMERHAPDRKRDSDGIAAITQGSSGGRKIAEETAPHQQGIMDKPVYEDIVASFKILLPDVASILSRSEDLAKELNGGKPMSTAQAGLFTASYLAAFEPPQTVDRQESLMVSLPQTNNVADQLHANSDKFREVGLALEASKSDDIYGVLGSLTSTEFTDLWTTPWEIERRLRNAGLCDLLIACVVEAVNLGRGNPDWLSATGERRKEIFTVCLENKVRALSKKRSHAKGENTNQALYKQLLERQVILLQSYCKNVKQAEAVPARQPTGFSDSIW